MYRAEDPASMNGSHPVLLATQRLGPSRPSTHGHLSDGRPPRRDIRYGVVGEANVTLRGSPLPTRADVAAPKRKQSKICGHRLTPLIAWDALPRRPGVSD